MGAQSLWPGSSGRRRGARPGATMSPRCRYGNPGIGNKRSAGRACLLCRFPGFGGRSSVLRLCTWLLPTGTDSRGRLAGFRRDDPTSEGGAAYKSWTSTWAGRDRAPMCRCYPAQSIVGRHTRLRPRAPVHSNHVPAAPLKSSRTCHLMAGSPSSSHSMTFSLTDEAFPAAASGSGGPFSAAIGTAALDAWTLPCPAL